MLEEIDITVEKIIEEVNKLEKLISANTKLGSFRFYFKDYLEDSIGIITDIGIITNIIKEVDKLEVTTKEDIELDISECYPLNDDIYVYNGIEEDTYYTKNLTNEHIKKFNQEELFEFIFYHTDFICI